jgi:signal transduction histidine kinase
MTIETSGDLIIELRDNGCGFDANMPCKDGREPD